MSKESYPETWASRRAMLATAPLDYSLWVKKDHWSISEASKLLCGRNPHAKIPGAQLFNRQRRVIDLIDEAFAAAQAGEMKVARPALLPIHLLVEPSSFVRWATTRDFEVPPELQALGAVAPAQETPDEQLRDRVLTIARTLLIVYPSLTLPEVAGHEAMRAQVSVREVSDARLLEWLSLVQGPGTTS